MKRLSPRATRLLSDGTALLLFAAVSLLVAAPACAQHELKDIPDPDPEIERASFVVAEGFEVNLFAADPQLAKPIQISFDVDGRLWVASSEVYPQVKPGQQANDKILVLEDADGDGKADKTTVFAQGLLIPTAVEPGDGGAYVANSTELVFLKDSDGDGKADVRRVMLSGFGTEDTHHILHTLRWGPDGQLNFNQSVYIHSHVETPYGVRRLGGGGVWQFRPETMQLGVFMRGTWNPWGHAWDDWGQSFATDGAGGQGILYAFPGATFEPSPGAQRFLEGLNPGSPKYCGLEIVSGRALPADWQGSLITNDFRAHRVCRFVVSDDGAGFAAREQPEVIKSSHPAFRPVDVKQGPDGAIYIADWYNPIIQHGEVDFRDPRRDKTHGRIWRVTATALPPVERPKLADASVAELLDALRSPEGRTRHFAKRALKQRRDEVAQPLAAWVADLAASHPDYEHHLVEALWTYQQIDLVEPELLKRVLKAQDPNARAAATRVLGQWHAQLPDALELLQSLVVDAHPRVRLEAVRALATLGTAEAAQSAMLALDKPIDRFLSHALYLTASQLQAVWLPALERGDIDFGGDPVRLAFAVEAAGTAGSSSAARRLLALVAANNLPPARELSLLVLVAALGNPQELAAVFERALADSTPPAARAELLAGLVRSARQRKVQPAGDLARAAQLVASQDEAVAIAALEAAGAWHLQSLVPQLTKLAQGSSATLRAAALRALSAIGGPESRTALERLAQADAPPAIRVPALAALVPIQPDQSAAAAVQLLAKAPVPEPELTVLLNAFLENTRGVPALTKALAGSKLSADNAKLATRILRGSALEQPGLLSAIAVAGGLAAGPKKHSPAEIQALVERVATEGDAAKGQAIFRRADAACLKCHALGGAGGRVGPDLLSIGASAQPDYLLESILDPNAKIKENYHSLIVTTDEGHIYSGIKVRQNEKDLVLRDAEDREIAVPQDSIDEKKASGSLMPIGLADALTERELIDLVRFLSELGKQGPYAIDKARVVRRWQTPVAPSAPLAAPAGALEASGGLSWQPVYSLVSGDLPLADCPAVVAGPDGKRKVLRFQLDVSTPGKVQIELPSAVRRVTLDGEAQPLPTDGAWDLSSGVHLFGLEVAADGAEATLRVGLQDVAGSPAQVQIVGGK